MNARAHKALQQVDNNHPPWITPTGGKKPSTTQTVAVVSVLHGPQKCIPTTVQQWRMQKERYNKPEPKHFSNAFLVSSLGGIALSRPTRHRVLGSFFVAPILSNSENLNSFRALCCV